MTMSNIVDIGFALVVIIRKASLPGTSAFETIRASYSHSQSDENTSLTNALAPLPTIQPQIRAEDGSTEMESSNSTEVPGDSNVGYDYTFIAVPYASSSLKSPGITARALVPRQDDSYQSFVLGPFPQPTSSAAIPIASAASICPAGNGTTYTSAASVRYQISCNVDFLDNDFPFQLVGSLAGCVQKCDDYNNANHKILCVAALFVPSREADANDCYLKSSISHPVVSTLQIEGALRLSGIGDGQFSASASSTVATPTNGTSKFCPCFDCPFMRLTDLTHSNAGRFDFIDDCIVHLELELTSRIVCWDYICIWQCHRKTQSC